MMTYPAIPGKKTAAKRKTVTAVAKELSSGVAAAAFAQLHTLSTTSRMPSAELPVCPLLATTTDDEHAVCNVSGAGGARRTYKCSCGHVWSLVAPSRPPCCTQRVALLLCSGEVVFRK